MTFKSVVLSLLLVLFIGTSANAQTPGVAVQNSLSFENAGNNVTNKISNFGLITLYPTGGSTFNVPNVGAVVPAAFEATVSGIEEVRVVDSSAGKYIGKISFSSPGQINVVVQSATVLSPLTGINLTGNQTVKVQRKISGTWTDVSTAATVYFEWVTPHFSTVYSGSTPQINADLYVYDGVGGYVFLKKTLDGNLNPKTYNGQPTVLAFYVTGGRGPIPFQEICSAHVKIGGTNNDSLLVSNFVASGFDGVQQINMVVPSNITSTTSIQLGAKHRYLDACPGSEAITYGSIGYIPNWQ